mmetsp:Transcript_8478/g.20743  ORF Transcript_8478/g.20743 Transcript_8478/m.20743 type:complete len:614 (+) Transcript_8478:255-2096(+)
MGLQLAMKNSNRFISCCCFILPLISNALLQPLPRHSVQPSSTSLDAFFDDGKKTKPRTSNVNLGEDRVNGGVDLVKTLELKDEALMQAQTAVSSLESALESAVTNLEYMQQQLQIQVVQLEQELETTKQELGGTKSDLERANTELRETQAELLKSQQESTQLELALAQSQEAAKRADELEAYVTSLTDGANEADDSPSPAKKENQWQLFSSNQRVIPILNEWIAIKGTNEGEIQISGKVTNHPTISNGDAIVTSPLMDPNAAAEKKVVTTLSGSKYRLGTPMTMPSSESPSQKITSPKKKKSPMQLIKARSSITLPDLSGNTLGNGRYLLAGDSTSSINGRSYIQTAYRASAFGKPTGEALAIKYSPNKEAMKREWSNYQKVSQGMKRGNFIRRVEFMTAAGNEMPDNSALVMQRGVADVKAFMPKVGGKLEGELLMDCALTALRCVEALHSVKLVWNDLKTENFVVIEDQKGGVSFRGIDLESCMLVNSPPVDYTPEACPPEFARSFLDGDAESFSLEYSYDVWSYGMFLYEVSTGRGFFDGYSAEKITKTVPTFQPNLEKVTDPELADLIGQCLSRNAQDRPSVARIFRHPFFANVSSGKNPFDFLFGVSI